MNTLSSSSVTFNNGADSLNFGLNKFVSGVDQAANGGQQVSSGADQFVSGTQQLAEEPKLWLINLKICQQEFHRFLKVQKR